MEIVGHLNWMLERTDAVALAAIAPWQINYIRPFIDRVRRVVCCVVSCIEPDGLLPGSSELPGSPSIDRFGLLAAC